MGELPVYRFPATTGGGVLLGLSLPRLVAVGVAGVVLVAVTVSPTLVGVLAGGALIAVLAVAASVRVGGRTPVEWLPVWVGFGWAAVTGNRTFLASPDLLDAPLPEGLLDLPGEVFGFELHAFTAVGVRASVANPTAADYGVLVDTFRDRLVVVAEVSGEELLFLDPDDQQVRIGGFGQLLDHVGQSLPDISRLQVVHEARPASAGPARRWHADHGGRGDGATAGSYRLLLDTVEGAGQDHRLLVAVALDRRAARRTVRHAGGGRDAAAAVLLDRATTVETALTGAGLTVHGWLPARRLAAVLAAGYDPAVQGELDARPGDVADGGGCDAAVAGPTAVVEGWSHVRTGRGWAATFEVTGPPSRPVTGEFLQHLLIGVDVRRRMSLLYVPTPARVAERRAQTQQVSAESEQALRARWGFATSARTRRHHGDAAVREAELVEGRAVFRLVWTITVLADTLPGLEADIGRLETAARRCALELRRLVGTQRQATSFTLPLCRGAR